MSKPRTPKTVRFASIVERSGQPEVHTLWVAPEKDPVLRRAEKECRVMTISRPRGHADIGQVGFERGTDLVRQYLIFPRSLARFKGDRIVGIKFERVAQPKLVAARASKRAAKRPVARKPTPPPKPKLTTPPPPPEPVPPKKPDSPLQREIRAAMEALAKGHSVAARKKLERLLVQT